MREFFATNRENLFLYVPFIMAFGGAAYFGLTTEPSIPYFNIIVTIIAIMSGIGMILLQRTVLLRAVLIFIFGFAYAAAFTYFVATPKLNHNIRNADIIGVVENIDYTPDKTRIFIRTNGITDNESALIRVSMNNDNPPPHIGDKIHAKVTLFSPDVASAPEAFDFARWAYFNGITATGYITEYSVVANSRRHIINSVRDYLHNTSKSFLVDGLILGYKNSIPSADKTVWTTSGIGHVWSISGFHFALMAGWLFAIFYFIFRGIAPITRRIPARITAMIAVWIMLLMYMAISGAAVATVRAFLMISLVIMALILGRGSISLRNVCLVFCAVFIINPHYVMQAGFQLSFSAVFGLVWLFNSVKPKMPNNKILKIIYAAILTSVVATIFTAPFVITHFYSLPLYSLIGNLVLLPIFSLAIMPIAAIGTITSIFGIMMPLDVAHIIYSKCLYLANIIDALPYANIRMPHISNTAICLTVIGFMSLILIRSGKIKINYILCGVCITAAILITAIKPSPVFFVTSDHELAAFTYDNKLEFTKSRAANHFFAFDTFKQLHGDDISSPNVRRKPVDGVWIYNTPKFDLAYIQKFVPLQENIVGLCRDTNIDYIVSYFKIDAARCHAKILHGGFVIYPSGHIHYTPHNRPWHIQHK